MTARKDPYREHGTNTRLAPKWDELARIYFNLAATATNPELREKYLETAESHQREATKLRNRNIELERMMK